MEKHSSVTAYLSGLGTALFGTVTLQEVAIYVGIMTTVGTFFINLYYKRREDRRQEVRYGKLDT